MLIPLFVYVQPPPAPTPPAVVVKIGTPYIEERRTGPTTATVPPCSQTRKAAKPHNKRS